MASATTPDRPAPEVKHPRLSAAARWAALAATAVGATAGLLQILGYLRYPYPFDYGEGPCLERVLAVMRGDALYPPMDRPPFVAWVYTPLYAWACAFGATLTGAPLLTGRLISAGAALACAGLLFILARRETGSRWWGAMAAMLFLGTQPVGFWCGWMRVDALGLALGLGGMATLGRRASPLLPGLLFGLAILTKQSLLAPLAAGCLWLAVGHGRRRDAVRVAAVAAACVGAVVAWQMASTDGWFWRHVVTANRNLWYLPQATFFLTRFAGSHVALLLLAGLGWLLCPAPRTRSLALWYLLTACASALLVGKVGATINYFLEACAALAVVGACGGARLWALAEKRGRPALGEVSVACLLIAHTLLTARPPASLDGSKRIRQAFAHRLAAEAPPVLCDDPGLLLSAGHGVWLQPFEYTQMARQGDWNQSPVVDALRQGRLSAVALSFNPWRSSSRDAWGTWAEGRFTEEMVAAIRENYHPVFQQGRRVILKPNRADRLATEP